MRNVQPREADEMVPTCGWCRPMLTSSLWIISRTARTFVWIRAIICDKQRFPTGDAVWGALKR